METTTSTMSYLDSMAKKCHETSVSKGFWDNGFNNDVYGQKLALIHSEVSEWLEAIRKEKGSYAEVEEIADVIIRLLDLYEARNRHESIGISLDDVLQSKMKKNGDRPHKHGRLF